VMQGHEKSDPAIVAKKPTNKAGRLAAEPVERRAETEGNTGQQAHAGRRTGCPDPRRANGEPRSAGLKVSHPDGVAANLVPTEEIRPRRNTTP
jgi:hypothetical protein